MISDSYSFLLGFLGTFVHLVHSVAFHISFCLHIQGAGVFNLFCFSMKYYGWSTAH